MRSIRRSLLWYILGLMTVALAAVSVVVDRLANRAFTAGEQAAAESTGLRYDKLIDDEHAKFDQDLAEKANRVVSQVQREYATLTRQEIDNFGHHLRYSVLATLAAGTAPSRLPAAMLTGTVLTRRFGTDMAPLYFSHLPLKESPSVQDHDDYVQVRIASSSFTFRSLELESAGWNWPLSFRDFNSRLTFEQRYDRIPGRPGQELRRIVLKAPLAIRTQGGFFGGPPVRGGGGGGRGNPPGGQPGGRPPGSGGFGTFQLPNDSTPVSNIYVQYAIPTDALIARIDDLNNRRTEDLAALTRQTATQRAWLRLWLAAIPVVAFLGALLGGMWLVKHGLTPLNRLSTAVSQVSEKDFRLPLKPGGLPQELLPIHERLVHTFDQLKNAFQREKQATADISHELRTPIAALAATLDVSLRKPRTPEQYKQTLEECREINKQLARLVERILTLAKIDAGTDRSLTGEVDAAAVADGCITLIRPLAEAHGLTVSAAIDRPLKLTTDPDKVREVLMNLLHNAVEYNAPGGKVELKVSANGRGGAVFEVNDTGIGMSDEVRARIFERFFRADPSRTATGVHAGLGLAIVKEYVNRLGGSIDVESRPGQGSRFRVNVPSLSV